MLGEGGKRQREAERQRVESGGDEDVRRRQEEGSVEDEKRLAGAVSGEGGKRQRGWSPEEMEDMRRRQERFTGCKVSGEGSKRRISLVGDCKVN